MSIIGCKDCLIEGSEFSRTFGAAPAAGIDLEPDAPNQDLSNISIRNCYFRSNHGAGINSWLNSWTLDQQCEFENQHRVPRRADWWHNCTTSPLELASITIEDCHVIGGPIANTSDGRSFAPPSSNSGGFTFGRIGPTTAGGSIVIKASSASNLPSFGIYSWDHHIKGAKLTYANVTLTNVGKQAGFVGLGSPQASHSVSIPCAPVGLDFLGGGTGPGACANSSCVGNIRLDGITVVDDMPRSWLQVSAHYAQGSVSGSASVTNPHRVGCTLNVSGATSKAGGLKTLPVLCRNNKPLKTDDGTGATGARSGMRWAMSGADFEPHRMQGWVNLGFTIGPGTNFTAGLPGQLAAWTQFGIPSLAYLEWWDLQVFQPGVGLRQGWRAGLATQVAKIKPHFGPDKAIRGVGLGDELCCRNTTCWQDYVPYTKELRRLLGADALIYTNECWLGAKAMANVTMKDMDFDLFSVDAYQW